MDIFATQHMFKELPDGQSWLRLGPFLLLFITNEADKRCALAKRRKNLLVEFNAAANDALGRWHLKS